MCLSAKLRCFSEVQNTGPEVFGVDVSVEISAAMRPYKQKCQGMGLQLQRGTRRRRPTWLTAQRAGCTLRQSLERGDRLPPLSEDSDLIIKLDEAVDKMIRGSPWPRKQSRLSCWKSTKLGCFLKPGSVRRLTFGTDTPEQSTAASPVCWHLTMVKSRFHSAGCM